MKKLSILFPLLILLSSTLMAQAPERFNYQAVVRDNGGNQIQNQTVSFRLSILEGGASGTVMYAETHSVNTNQFGLVTLPVGGGTLFSGSFASINWGGNTHFLQVETDVTGGSSYTLMGTTQLLAVPYALHATTVENDQVDDADNDPNNEIQTISKTGTTVTLSNGGGTYTDDIDDADNDPNNENQTLTLSGQTLSISNGNSVTLTTGGNTLDQAYDQGGAGAGRQITADAGAVQISSGTANAIVLDLDNTNTGVCLAAENSGAGTTFSTVQAITNSVSNQASAVVGNTDGAAWGVSGQVSAGATASAAVYGSNLRTNGGMGVRGVGFNGTVGETNYVAGFAVYGENFDMIGTGNGIGVAGKGYWGVVGEDRYLGTIAGAFGVFSNGTLGGSGTKAFQIDHPDDPANKYLRHFSMESDEVLNYYRGNATFDANGEAVVELPDYFDGINRNFSYQLTPVGAYMPLFIKEKVQGNQFVIAGGTAGMEVSWGLVAERNDPYLQQYPDQRQVIIEKRDGDKGKYLMPALYGEDESKGILPKKGVEVDQPKVTLQR